VQALDELASFARFLRHVPSLAATRYTAVEGRAIVRDRIAHREENFLRTLERNVFANPRSAYGRLLAMAGCEPGDVRQLVHERGLEGALRALKDAGVYVTFDEFKGNRPIVRGSVMTETTAADFDAPAFRSYFTTSTGGSSGAPRRVLMDLAYLESRKPMHAVMMDAHALAGVPMVQWAEAPPGHGLEAALIQSIQDGTLHRWFTPMWTGSTGTAWRFRAATRAAVWTARRCGVPVPHAEPLPLDRADVIVRWAQEALATHGRCGIRAHVSKALRIAIAARELGVDLTGTTITSGGEPVTPAKARTITATGARFIPNYFIMEAGPVGLGCPMADDPGDQHFQCDRLALITGARPVPSFGATVDAFYLTSLLPSAPKMFLNVETDDFGIVEERSCGCPFDALGLCMHLREIRSFSKLTGEGVTLIGSEMERLLEQDLPARFGGSPLDYQLVEEEDGDGFTRLTLLVHPRVRLANEDDVVPAMHRLLAERGGAAGVTSALWRQAGTIRLRREAPRITARGKQWLLHARTRNTDAGAALTGDATGTSDAGNHQSIEEVGR